MMAGSIRVRDLYFGEGVVGAICVVGAGTGPTITFDESIAAACRIGRGRIICVWVWAAFCANVDDDVTTYAAAGGGHIVYVLPRTCKTSCAVRIIVSAAVLFLWCSFYRFGRP